MRPLSCALLLVPLFATLTGCRSWPAAVTDARRFEAAAKPPLRVVLFPPSCSAQDGGCDDVDVGGVFGILRSELELAGYTVVDGAELVAEARTRETAGADLRLFGAQVASAGGIHQSGALFADLPPAVRRQVLEEARADGIVRVSLTLSSKDAAYPLYDVRRLEVQGRLGLGVDETPAWAIRCKDIWVTAVQFIGGPDRSYAQGAEEGARCVAQQATAP